MSKKITSFLFLLLSTIQSSKKTLSYILSVLLLWFVSAQAISFAQDPIVDPIEIEWRQLNPSKTELLNKSLSAIDLGEYKDANSSIKPNMSMDGGGFNYRSQSNGSLITLSPQYSKQTGFAIGGVFAKSITDNAALGVIFNAGADRNEWLVNAGYDINQNQRVILSLGQLRQNLEFSFQSGLEKTQVTQNNGALSYQYLLGKSWLNAAEFNAYISDTPSINLTDKTWYTNTNSLYELWNDPRRIAGAKVEGVQSRLVFTPTTKTTLKLGFGAEHLSYDLSLGKDTYTRATGSVEFNQRLDSGFNLNASANLASSQNRFGLALSRSFKDGQQLSIDALAIRGRDNTFDDNLITFNFSQTFGGVKSNVVAMNMQDAEIKLALSNASQKDLADNDANPKANWVSNLVNAVAKRPTFLPSQVNAKIDTTASSTRLIAINKTGIPTGSTIENATGILTVPIQVGGIDVPVSAIASITKNGSAFTNSGQFALSGSTYLMINPNLITQPATTDTYIVTMTNVSGGGTTLATITVSHGSTTIDSVVIVSGILTPTITFANISKTFGESAFALSPSSDSSGAFTFASSDTSVATISGSTVTILKNGVSTITATQAANGNYSSGTATATLTVGAAGIVAAPAFSPAAGAIAFPTTITLSSTTAGATIYYTIDGSTPTTASTQGTSVVVNSAQTIKAFAIKTGWTDSSTSSAAYTQAQATAPTSITLAVGSTAAVGGVTNVAIPSAGATDSTGAVTGWESTTASKIKFTVVNGGSASSTITIGGNAYTSGADYSITAASTLTVVVTTTETGKTSAIRTFSISVTAAPTFTSTGLIINYDASNFSNGASTWTNLGTGGATYNGVVIGPPLSLTGTSPAAISIGGNGNPQTKYIRTNYVTNDAAWTIEVIAKALSTGGSGDSLIRKDGVGTGWWFGAQGNTWYFRNQTAGADTSRHVITFGSNGKIWIDGVLKNTITGTQNSDGDIEIKTGITGNTWEISRFKYYDRTLSDAEITSNSSKQKTELGF